MGKKQAGKKNNMNNINDNIKVDMVTADQMTEEDRRAIFDMKPNIEGIPDLSVITGYIFDILVYLDVPETVTLLKKNNSAVKMHLNNKYADTVPLGIITLLMEESPAREENVEQILKFFESLQDAKDGKKTLEEVENKLAEDVKQRYEYSKYGSKEAFEQALMKGLQKERLKERDKNIEGIKNVGRASIKN